VRVRKDVYKLASTDKTLDWYGKAIHELAKRPIKDPTSWRYQAAIHGYSRSEDPLKKSSDVLPSSADQSKFWNQCQHGSWYFLSWHRGYLLYFERLCLAAIVKLGGPKDWALLYWNYSSSGSSPDVLAPPTSAADAFCLCGDRLAGLSFAIGPALAGFEWLPALSHWLLMIGAMMLPMRRWRSATSPFEASRTGACGRWRHFCSLTRWCGRRWALSTWPRA
jgi:hypothetical protein